MANPNSIEQIIRIAITRDIKIMSAQLGKDITNNNLDVSKYEELFAALALLEQEADRLLLETYV